MTYEERACTVTIGVRRGPSSLAGAGAFPAVVTAGLRSGAAAMLGCA